MGKSKYHFKTPSSMSISEISLVDDDPYKVEEDAHTKILH